MSFHADSGFQELTELFNKYIKGASEDLVDKALEIGAEAFVDDLGKLPRPRSKIGGAHTHLLDTFSYGRKVTNKGPEYQVGWGVYYGRMVEHGTVKMKAQAHLRPTWDTNESKYVGLMRDYFIENRPEF